VFLPQEMYDVPTGTTDFSIGANSSSNRSETLDRVPAAPEVYGVYFIAVDVAIVMLISIAGLFGNGLVVVWATYFHRLTIPVNVYIINLAVADCVFAASLPMFVPNLLARG
jgi:hypothetical protein